MASRAARFGLATSGEGRGAVGEAVCFPYALRRMVQEMFGPGGKGVFVPEPGETALQQSLDGVGFA